MDQGSKDRAVRGVAWASAANWGSQLLNFGVYAGLARLLNPKTFGLIAMGGVYTAFIQIFVTQGFGAAIIQRKELDKEHLDSAFWIALSTAVVFCLSSILLAGVVGRIFREPAIVPVIRWISLTIVLFALSSIPTAVLTRELDFRALAVRTLLATALGGAVGLALAFLHMGVWSLVGQQIAGAVAGAICLWAAVPWRPGLRISRRHLRDLYGFSLSLTGNDILWFFSQKSDQTLVGYAFGPAGLGPYSLGAKLVQLAYDAVVGPFQTVAFPAFSRLQNDPAELERALNRFCEISSFLCLPIFLGMAAVAPEIVPLLFGPRWSAAVGLLEVLCLYGAVRVVLTFMHPFMLARGRPGLYLALSVVLSALTVSACLVAMHASPRAVAAGMAISLALFFAIFLVVARRSLGIRTLPLVGSFVFPALCSLFMLLVVRWVRALVTPRLQPAPALLLLVPLGVVSYLATAYLLRRDLVGAIWSMTGGSLLGARARGGARPAGGEGGIEETTVKSAEA